MRGSDQYKDLVMYRASALPEATVIIVTKNRSPELRRAIRSSLSQDLSPAVLVIDDGSTDGTSDMVRKEFPEVGLHTYSTSAGLIVRRNLAAILAKTPIIVSIDDDAVFSTPFVLTQALAQFSHERVAVVAIPFVNVNAAPTVMQHANDSYGIYVSAGFIGTAHALRRDVFLTLGGYNEFLFHQGEEEDFAIRLLDAGYVVRLGAGDPIHHFESPKRDFRRMDVYGRRNHVLFAYQRVPMPYTISHLGRATLRGILEGTKKHRLLQMTKGLLRGYTDITRHPRLRAVVKCMTYRVWMRLRRMPALELKDIEAQLPPFMQTVDTLGTGAAQQVCFRNS